MSFKCEQKILEIAQNSKFTKKRGVKVSRKKSVFYIVTDKCRKLYKDEKRLGKKYTLETLAEEMEMISGKKFSENTVKHWFATKDKKPITWENAQILAKVLDCEVYDFVGYDGFTSFRDDFKKKYEAKQDIEQQNRDSIKTLLSNNKQSLPFPDDNDDWNNIYLDLLNKQLLALHANNLELLKLNNARDTMKDAIEQIKAMGVTVTLS